MNPKDVGKGVLDVLGVLGTSFLEEFVGDLLREGWRAMCGPRKRRNRNPAHAEWCEGRGRFCTCVCLCEHTAPQHKRTPLPGSRLPDCLGMFTCDCER